MSYIKWPCDWNRPLSEEEQAIARRLDRAAENPGVETLVGDINPWIPDKRPAGDSKNGRGKDAPVGPKRNWVRGQPEFIEGDG